MGRQRLVAIFVGGLMLLSVEGYRMRQRAAAWFVVGVASNGDTVAMNRGGYSDSTWLLEIHGPGLDGRRYPSIFVDCGARAAGSSRYPAVLELRGVIVDTACASR